MERVENMENIVLVVNKITSTKFQFSDQPILRCQKIKNIDIPSVTDVSVTPNGKAVVNNVVYAKSFLVLSVNGSEQINRIPLKSLNPYSNNGRRIEIDNIKINWTKSYIEVGSIAGLVADEAFYLNVFF